MSNLIVEGGETYLVSLFFIYHKFYSIKEDLTLKDNSHALWANARFEDA